MSKSIELPFANSEFSRQVAKSPIIPLKNMYIEQVPPLNNSQYSAIVRPALQFALNEGDGPIRKNFTSAGIFDDCSFVVNGLDLYRYEKDDLSSTKIGTIGTSILGSVSMAAVAQIDDTVPSRLFLCDGGILWVYTEDGQAIGHLQITGAVSAAETVDINGVYYKWTAGSVDTGTPAGTAISPWLVAKGATDAIALRNLYYAINAQEGTPGTDYSTLTTPNAFVTAYNYTSTDLFISSLIAGTAGNAYTTTETMTNGAWAHATLTGGGSSNLRQIMMPGDVGVVSLCSIDSYVILVPAQAEDLVTLGRFYWINPGNTTVDVLDYANAESYSDAIHQVITYRDQFLVFGRESTEAWIMSGDIDAPVQRYKGLIYTRGSIEGTAIKVRDALFVIDELSGAFKIDGNGMQRISRPDIEERIRKAVQQQSA